MYRVVLSGYYGFDNTGDEAILAALIKEIKREIGNVEIIVLSANPGRTKEVHQVKAVGRYNYSRLISIFRRSNLLISGGGSLLQDTTGWKTIPYYLLVIILAKFLRVPVFCCGQGVGPIKNKVNRKLVKQVLDRVEVITVRDEASWRLLKELGVKKDIYLTADPVFSLQPGGSKQRNNQILSQEGIELSSPLIGVSLRHWKNNDYIKEAAKLLDQLKVELKGQILFLPFKYPEDKEISRRVKLEMIEEAQLIKGDYNYWEILNLMEKMDLLVGMRLHSLIFAVIQQIVPAGISYDPKVNNFLKRLDLLPAGEVDSFKAESIYRKIISLWKKRKEIKEICRKKSVDLEGLARQNIELIKPLLKSGAL